MLKTPLCWDVRDGGDVRREREGDKKEREMRKRGRQEREDKRESGERDEIETRREREARREVRREKGRERREEREKQEERAAREREERQAHMISILFCYNVGPSTSYVAEKVVRWCVKKSGWLDGAKKCTVRSS